MLPKSRRIKREEFSFVLGKGVRLNSTHLFLFCQKINPENLKKTSRFSFSISKKVEKSAVKRNKLRRWGYSVLSNEINKTKDGFLLFFSYKNTKDLTYQVLQGEIIGLLSSTLVLE